MNDMRANATVWLNGTQHDVRSTGDGKTKVVYAFQDLVKLAYNKLKLLGEVNYDEKRLQQIVLGNTDDLFGEDDTSMSAAENEVMNFIQRRKKMNERTDLTHLKEHFTGKPYGWPEMATWAMVALLFKRGKIEARQDTNILEDGDFLNALLNSRQHSNTLIHPQIEFDQGQIRTLKQVHQDMFHESNPHNEAKDAGRYFRHKAEEELQIVKGLLAQRGTYPFVEVLDPLADLLDQVSGKNYAQIINDIGELEDDLLELKEDHLDPIKQFMNGGQKEIYDRLLQFEDYNQANFDYIDAEEKAVLARVKSDEAPYRGNTMKQAKEAMDTLEDRVKKELRGEKDYTVEQIEEKVTQLRNREEFSELDSRGQEKVLAPLQRELQKAKDERFIGNLQVQRSRLGDIYTDQLNTMMELAQPEEDDNEPKQQFIKQSNIHIPHPKKELQTEEDVEAYIENVRSSMLKHIRKNHHILLD
jgi:hypothetical protein